MRTYVAQDADHTLWHVCNEGSYRSLCGENALSYLWSIPEDYFEHLMPAAERLCPKCDERMIREQ